MTATARHPEHVRAEALRSAFVAEFALTPARWSDHNLSRMLRLTGERPARVAEMKSLIHRLGDEHHARRLATWGVFDHGEMFRRWGVPAVIVGHPYQIGDDERSLLSVLARYPGLTVFLDDRPSYYGWGTHHVRVELARVQRPWSEPRHTRKTRAFARAARQAFAEEFSAADE